MGILKKIITFLNQPFGEAGRDLVPQTKNLTKKEFSDGNTAWRINKTVSELCREIAFFYF